MQIEDLKYAEKLGEGFLEKIDDEQMEGLDFDDNDNPSHVIVAELGMGDFFGDHIVTADCQPISNPQEKVSVLCATNCHYLLLNKAAVENVVGQQNLMQENERIHTLRTISFFKKL